MNFWHFFDTLEKSLNIKVVGDSRDIVIGMWQEANLEMFLLRLLVGTQSKKCQKSVQNLGLVEMVACIAL